MSLRHPPRPPLPDALAAALAARFGERFSVAESVRAHHGRDESAHMPALPDAVLFAASTEEVAQAMRLCAGQRVPVIPFGVGSSVEGQVLAVRGGVCIGLSSMNRVLVVHAEDLAPGRMHPTTREDVVASGIVAPLFGHVGDGNFHLVVLVDVADPAEVAAAHAVSERLVRRALALEGTCSGEHGIGLGKREFLAAEHGEAVELMRRIKQALDPDGLLNPGKILPPSD